MSDNKYRMNAPFDRTAEHQRDIQPHIDAIFEKCKELDIPCLVTVCYSNEPTEDGNGTSTGIAMAANFCGPSKTPPMYVLASIAIEEGPEAAMSAAIALSGSVSSYRAELQEDEGPHAAH